MKYYFIIVFVNIIIFSCSNPWKKQEQLEVRLATINSQNENLRQKNTDIQKEFKLLMSRSLSEKDSLNLILISKEKLLRSSKSEISRLRNLIDNNDPASKDWISKIEALELNIEAIENEKVELQTKLIKNETQYKANVEAFINKTIDASSYVYDNLLEVSELKSKIQSTINNFTFGIKSLDAKSEIETNISKLDQRIKETKDYLEINFTPLDSIEAIKNVGMKLNTKINIFEESINAFKSEISPYISEITENNKGYYLVKSVDELKELEILKGKFLGVGNLEYNMNNVNSEMCKIVDKTGNNLIIPHNSNEEAKIYSNHLPSSYRIYNESATVTRVEIKNPTIFWSNSSYFVIGLN